MQLLCNIHSSMLGYVFVVDTPYYAQADGTGAFTIKGVPPGDYELEIWHEAAVEADDRARLPSAPTACAAWSSASAATSTRRQFLPDKSGKPRQSHLGY